MNEAWEVLGNAQRRAEYDTHYFRMRADMADAERKRQEAERQEWERRERLRQQEMELKRREAEAARQRAEAERRRRAEYEPHSRALQHLRGLPLPSRAFRYPWLFAWLAYCL